MYPLFHPRCAPLNRFFRAIAYVIARIICMIGSQICTIMDGETDVAVEMIKAKPRAEEWMHL
jgi:hypothetical protein